MKNLNIKLFAAFALFIPVIFVFAARPDHSGADRVANDDIPALYKSQCAMCHSPKAEKAFDVEMSDEDMVLAILDGKKAAKPPHMPAYRNKGIDEEKALALVKYMRELRESAGE
ncbi:MAG TPA: cytochrome c [Pyrinomonadaceae bacterium]|nr:cytochrome c [Pyrinomonadaceae bacterium]HMP64649.1 cytochrome c [Pyrinomonadaceae bacterium]